MDYVPNLEDSKCISHGSPMRKTLLILFTVRYQRISINDHHQECELIRIKGNIQTIDLHLHFVPNIKNELHKPIEVTKPGPCHQYKGKYILQLRAKIHSLSSKVHSH